jgi:hypothetical protein
MVHSTDAIINSFTAFAKFCIDKKEIPYFKYNSAEVDKFFYDMKKEYPKEFKMVSFDTNGHQPFSDITSQAKMDMLTCGYLFSWGFNPYFVSKNVLKNFEEIKDKETYLGIAKELYEKFGCDESGNLKNRTEFKSLERLH